MLRALDIEEHGCCHGCNCGLLGSPMLWHCYLLGKDVGFNRCNISRLIKTLIGSGGTVSTFLGSIKGTTLICLDTLCLTEGFVCEN